MKTKRKRKMYVETFNYEKKTIISSYFDLLYRVRTYFAHAMSQPARLMKVFAQHD